MSEQEDDGGDMLKEFLSTHGRDNFIPPKRTRKVRIENSVIKEPSKHKKKGKTSFISCFLTYNIKLKGTHVQVHVMISQPSRCH